MQTCVPRAGATDKMLKRAIYHSSELKHVGVGRGQGPSDVACHKRGVTMAVVPRMDEDAELVAPKWASERACARGLAVRKMADGNLLQEMVRTARRILNVTTLH